jgi:hypothetical protein
MMSWAKIEDHTWAFFKYKFGSSPIMGRFFVYQELSAIIDAQLFPTFLK